MRIRPLVSSFALALLVACGAFAQGAAGPEMTPEEQAEAARIIRELAQPAAEHAMLVESLVGSWETTTTFDFPGQGPTEFKGTAEARAILGGRFVHIDTVTESNGQRFENLSIVGFDRRSEEYTYIGLDNTGTYYVEGAGARDEESGEIRFDGIVNDPIFDRQEIYYFLLRIDDRDHHTWEIWFKQEDGEEFAMFAAVESVRAE